MNTSLGKFKVQKIYDGDTIEVDRVPMPAISPRKNLRLLNIDTEETTSPKELGPVTAFGKEVKNLAEQWFAKREYQVELKTDDGHCISDYYNRPLVHVFSQGDNYEQHAISLGWTPYFSKYGYSQEYHEILSEAEKRAERDCLGIWSNTLKQRPDSEGRPYQLLRQWWQLRAEQVQMAQEFQKKGHSLYNLLNGQDYAQILQKAATGEEVQIFGAISRPGKNRQGGEGLFEIQVKMDVPFYIYIPHESPQRQKLIDTIDNDYISTIYRLPESLLKPNFAFLRGRLSKFNYHGHQIPEMIVTRLEQIDKKPFSN